MKNYLDDLNNNQNILLMYLADELPEQERLQVERLLTSDAGLRAELEALRAAQRGFLASIEAMDAAESPAVPDSLAQRQVNRLIHRWAHERFETSPPPVIAPPTPIAWRQISFAAAAALLIGVYVWAAYHPIDVTGAGRDGGLFANKPLIEKSSPVNSDEIKLAMLSSSLEDSASASQESSNAHLAAFAALEPGTASEGDLSIDAVRGSDRRNEMGEP